MARPLTALLLTLAAGLAGCSSPLVPAPPSAVPDLRASWTGTWGGQPLSVLVTDQDDLSGTRGLFLGSWQVLGERTTSLTAVMTSTIRGEPVSANASGRVGYAGGVLTILMSAETSDGIQTLRLSPRGPDRLQGRGESSFRWGPSGPVDLTRR